MVILKPTYFCVCMPFFSKEEECQSIKQIQQFFAEHFEGYRLNPAFGLYIVNSATENVESMYDKAILAARQCKGSYTQNYAFFEAPMLQRIERDNELYQSNAACLTEGQFVVYYQPEVFHQNRSIRRRLGLAIRWRHPKEGIISPGEFIPLFEKNGFITQLDSYVWEQVCMMLNKRAQEAKVLYPISVNVSRVDFARDRRWCQRFCR